MNEEEEKKTVDVESTEKKDESPKEDVKPEVVSSSNDDDHSKAIHGFGTAAHYMFIPGIIGSAVSFGASLTCNIVEGIIRATTQSENFGTTFFSILARIGWGLFSGLFIPALIGGIVFHCLTRHFKSIDPKWKDKVEDDNAF